MASMSTTTSDMPGKAQPRARRTSPVRVWAGVGAVLLAFELYLLVRWVFGPDLHRVAVGPDQPPGWMKVAIVVAEVLSLVALAVWVHVFLVRPWRRHHMVPFEGLFAIALMFTSVYDPVSNYIQTWLTYNAYFVNWGSPISNIPGWLSYTEPGAAVAWPVLFGPSAYVWLMGGVAIAGRRFLTWVRTRWTSISTPTLVVVCFIFATVIDFVIEGLGLLRLGLYTYSGGLGGLSTGHYYKFPLSALFTAAAMFTAMICLAYFRDDLGNTIVERGAQPSAPDAKSIVSRFLAILAASQIIFFVTYHLPAMLIVSIHQPTWPLDVQHTSYLNDHLCGTGTGRACPGPNVPISGPRAPYLGTDGVIHQGMPTSLP